MKGSNPMDKYEDTSSIVGYKSRFSSELLKKTARALDVASIGAWVTARALNSGLTGALMQGCMTFNMSNDLRRYLRERRGDYEFSKFAKYESGFWTAVGTAGIGATVYDALSGRFENIPGDVSLTAASYMEAVSKGIHYLADKRNNQR